MTEKILVAMSGGVDSSVAALLLQQAGHKISGVTMRLVMAAEADGTRSSSADPVEDARRVCERLDVPHFVLDFAPAMEAEVIAPFVAAYRRGRTPNPCVDCNRALKFGALLEQAKALGFDALATGHYARIVGVDGAFHLERGRDRSKDQSYFLYPIRRDNLEAVRLPLGDYEKAQVRAIAVKENLPVAQKAESQDICFVTRNRTADFLARRLGDVTPGPIVDQAGRELGRHKGIPFYTVGQRGGLGISAKRPLYVLALDAADNRIVVGEKRDLLAAGCIVAQVNRLENPWPVRVAVKIRYRNAEVLCRVGGERDTLKVIFEETQESVTPGQSAVFYDGDRVLGGGIIEEALP